ncbi:hypothetical protein D3C87_817840 [compost metagenome]
MHLPFKFLGERVVVDAVSGCRSSVEQRHDQHGGLEVAGYQVTDNAGAVDVLAQLFDIRRRTLIGVWHHRSTLETFLGDFGPAYRRAPQRLHPCAVDAFGEEQFVVNLFEHVQVIGVEDVSFGVFNHHPHRAAQAAQRLAVLQEIFNVRLALRNHLLEAGTQLETGRHHVTQYQGDHCHEQHEQGAVIEDPPFQPVSGTSIEVLQVANHRHRVLLDIAHVWVPRIDTVLILVKARAHHGCRPTPMCRRLPERRRQPVTGFAEPSISSLARHPG